MVHNRIKRIMEKVGSERVKEEGRRRWEAAHRKDDRGERTRALLYVYWYLQQQVDIRRAVKEVQKLKRRAIRLRPKATKPGQ